jgi:hypothetical protein
VRQIFASGEIPSVKIGEEYRVIDIELDNFIENQRVAA